MKNLKFIALLLIIMSQQYTHYTPYEERQQGNFDQAEGFYRKATHL